MHELRRIFRIIPDKRRSNVRDRSRNFFRRQSLVRDDRDVVYFIEY